MKKTLLFATFIVASIALNAQTYLLTFEALYSQLKTGKANGTETSATYDGTSTTKLLLNADRTIGIFTLVSPSTRTFRIDTCIVDVSFNGHSHVAKARLEPNGASNTTNGRKIYIECPAAGKLTVGAWTATAGRGYTVENSSGVLYSTNSAMTAVTSTTNLPIHEYVISSPGTIILNPNAGFYYGFVQFDVTTSVSSVLSNSGILISKTEIQNTNKLELDIYNVLGKKLLTSKENVNLSTFNKGVYILRIAGTNQSLKFTI